MTGERRVVSVEGWEYDIHDIGLVGRGVAIMDLCAEGWIPLSLAVTKSADGSRTYHVLARRRTD